ncbi:MAG: ABC transporter ATP-binding protein, partial [Acidimicrobiales bacterium]|nr:ABC transporter ATP-binding protein [Acidimicrobiales bacterium]
MTRDHHDTADVRLLASYLRPERRTLAALVAILVVAMLLPLAGPLLVGRFVDAALAGDDTAVLARLAVAFLLCTLTGDALQLVVTWLSVRLAWRVGNSLRTDLCRHALGLDLDWHADHSPGQLIERIDGDIDAVTRFSSAAILHLAGNVLLLVGVLVVTIAIDWRAAVVVSVSVSAAVTVMILLRRAAVPYYDAEREVQSQLYGDLEERLGGLEDLRANGAGRWATHRLHHNSARWWLASRRASLRGDGALSLAGMIFATGTVVMLALGVWLARRGDITVGTVIVLVRISDLLADPLWRVAEQLSEAQRAVAGTRRAARLLSDRSALVDGQGAVLPAGALDAELRSVTFSYGTGHPVLDGVDLLVPAGTSVGIVGRTGSGKTSVGRLLARLWDTEEGQVLIGGHDIRTLKMADLRRRTAVVTQDVELFRATVRDNLTIFGALEDSDEALRHALGSVGLDPWLATLEHGLDQVIDGAADLSAGEAQLLTFARVLLADPALVILDEASSRLDPFTEAKLEKATTALLQGRTAVIIAHRLSTLDDVDSICVLDRGRVVEHAPRQQLVADPTSRFAR